MTFNVMTLEEAAVALRLRPETLRRPWWRRRYGLPGVRIGGRVAFLEADVRVWLEGHREPVVGQRPKVIDVIAAHF